MDETHMCRDESWLTNVLKITFYCSVILEYLCVNMQPVFFNPKILNQVNQRGEEHQVMIHENLTLNVRGVWKRALSNKFVHF